MRYLALLLALSFAGTADARPRHWFTDPKWWLGEVIIASAIAADAHSTADRSRHLVEGNHLLGGNPSKLRVAGLASLSMGLQTTYHAAAWHYSVGDDDPSKAWRLVGYTAIPIVCVSIYGHAAVHNYQLDFPKMTAKPSMIQVNK